MIHERSKITRGHSLPYIQRKFLLKIDCKFRLYCNYTVFNRLTKEIYLPPSREAD